MLDAALLEENRLPLCSISCCFISGVELYVISFCLANCFRSCSNCHFLSTFSIDFLPRNPISSHSSAFNIYIYIYISPGRCFLVIPVMDSPFHQKERRETSGKMLVPFSTYVIYIYICICIPPQKEILCRGAYLRLYYILFQAHCCTEESAG